MQIILKFMLPLFAAFMSAAAIKSEVKVDDIADDFKKYGGDVFADQDTGSAVAVIDSSCAFKTETVIVETPAKALVLNKEIPPRAVVEHKDTIARVPDTVVIEEEILLRQLRLKYKPQIKVTPIGRSPIEIIQNDTNESK